MLAAGDINQSGVPLIADTIANSGTGSAARTVRNAVVARQQGLRGDARDALRGMLPNGTTLDHSEQPSWPRRPQHVRLTIRLPMLWAPRHARLQQGLATSPFELSCGVLVSGAVRTADALRRFARRILPSDHVPEPAQHGRGLITRAANRSKTLALPCEGSDHIGG